MMVYMPMCFPLRATGTIGITVRAMHGTRHGIILISMDTARALTMGTITDIIMDTILTMFRADRGGVEAVRGRNPIIARR